MSLNFPVKIFKRNFKEKWNALQKDLLKNISVFTVKIKLSEILYLNNKFQSAVFAISESNDSTTYFDKQNLRNLWIQFSCRQFLKQMCLKKLSDRKYIAFFSHFLFILKRLFLQLVFIFNQAFKIFKPLSTHVYTEFNLSRVLYWIITA